ncbi:hypothetical protein A3841_09575 [Pontibacter flavimaris]|uniref:Uncharacterized protein n=1 Tax=Pontibacter flavimaris TaxID=1797110 RepID=A0A1Q5PGE9_9BACT|nr:hypothetical protein A3841_09575 [Pontibacter flavimaris]
MISSRAKDLSGILKRSLPKVEMTVRAVAIELISAFGLSAYASFSGGERKRDIATQEQRKSSQRDALVEGPHPQGEASRP